MPVICVTLASCRRLFWSVRFLPKIASFSQGNLPFSRAAAFSTRSRNSIKVRLSVVLVLAAKFLKKVTWTFALAASCSLTAGSLICACERSVSAL
ncbi:hypothetical protein ACVWYH_000890 [Bradyrhizobium sp. GM24.11]